MWIAECLAILPPERLEQLTVGADFIRSPAGGARHVCRRLGGARDQAEEVCATGNSRRGNATYLATESFLQ
ncbi:hypothetical protein WT09_03795 [Burkholderia stagnalis]|nr:hypothetical protein WT74_22970 [Burkholderia stagnalis]KVN24086.1 hypothetical protein WT09_03795 [Burkholderia stagnalis]KVX59018.1 hypothetical protein WT33_20475 [Burkholderia stagnalis]KWI26782.1 hypothetical protein WT71_00935 [Burkholderia stagnalis]KWI81324.1 hypothetical protein WT73_27690 [Burkholderia stagnalis]